MKMNDIAKAYAAASRADTKVTTMLTDALNASEYQTVGEAYAALLDKFGKRTRVPKADGGGFTDSTPADTFNTLVQRISNGLEMGKHRPVKVEENGKWTLEPVQGKKRAPNAKSLAKLREAYAEMVNTMSLDEKAGELAMLAELIGVKLPKGKVVTLPTQRKEEDTAPVVAAV